MKNEPKYHRGPYNSRRGKIKEKVKRLDLLLSDKEFKQLDDYAKRNKRKYSEIIRTSLKQYIENEPQISEE